jgi:hypothetical protein
MRKKMTRRTPTTAFAVLLILLATFALSCSTQAMVTTTHSTQTTAHSSATASSSTTTTPLPSTTLAPATTTTAKPTTTTQKATTTTKKSNVLSWEEAGDHVGQKVTIEGPVIGAMWAQSSSGSPTFLNIGRDYPDSDRLTVLIWEGNRDNFPAAPESLYAGKTIRVTGVIKLYKGSPQIEVKGPQQIAVQ